MDAICAITTALGGAVGIIRVSGDEAVELCGRVWHGRQPLSTVSPRMMMLGEAMGCDGKVLDAECLAVKMPGPHSYTGEDVVELQCHGGALCVRLVLEALIDAGCRMAEPGEFTKRAFLNGRLDLTQAEAVADVIGAGSTAALRMAGRQLKGLLGKSVGNAYQILSDLLAEIESRLDFPEEELDWRKPDNMVQDVEQVQSDIAKMLETRRAGEILRGGLTMAITGLPNVGKSSLLNAILGRERAIVTDIPGTTRDTIEEFVSVRGLPIRLIDTAGIREGGDVIERNGMERAKESAMDADVVLWVFDATIPYDVQAWPNWNIRGRLLLVANKTDVGSIQTMPSEAIRISALTGEGMDGLYEAIERLAGVSMSIECGRDVAVAARHAALLSEAGSALAGVARQFHAEEWELAAIGLRGAVKALGRIIGREVEPDVLEAIFSKFCIGK
ncbi:MAG: tRNA uridine-5-carboxymethylaminomethyl(34) synthesis GTPase MnmE [Victivallales bacterium]|nr:tRNA uridine-5-carboxymethylaminomethyl(34) synthesis GTPase MnmE [Victivallales bacterium]